jgi:hypothetical protein
MPTSAGSVPMKMEVYAGMAEHRWNSPSRSGISVRR